MRWPRMRFTIRQVMVVTALVALVFAWMMERERRGYPLLAFEYKQDLGDEPFINPTKVKELVWPDRIVLEDGRVIVIEEGPVLEGDFSPESFKETEYLVDVTMGPDDSATVYLRKQRRVCTSGPRRRPIRIPIVPRAYYGNYRALFGKGRISPPVVSSFTGSI
jgi:hypothetical protein